VFLAVMSDRGAAMQIRATAARWNATKAFQLPKRILGFSVLSLGLFAAGTASAQVTCPPTEISGTRPLPGCVRIINDTAPAAQAAIFGAQGIATQSNQAALDHLSELRQLQQGVGSAPLAFADWTTAYAKVRKGADPISPVLKAPPPAPAPTVRPATWLRAFGDFENRDANTAFTAAPNGTLFAFDQGYRQRTGGVLGGVDLLISGLSSANDALILGALGGYVASNVNMNVATHHMSGGTVGVYGTYVNGGFFLDAMAKADLLSFDTTALFLTPGADLTNFNLLSNVGYKFDLPSKWYIEPTAGIEYIRTDFSNQTVVASTFALLEDSHVLRGRFGARLGTEWITGNIRFEPSVLLLGYYYFEATGASVALGSAGGSIILPNDAHTFRGEVQASLNVFNLSTGVSGFVRGDLRFGDDIIGGGGKVGLRYQW
jgi:outer membrane autotransporter protein